MLSLLLTLAIIAFTSFMLFFLILPSRYVPYSSQQSTQEPITYEAEVSVQILVLGDIGRSPRMQNHALSISRHGGRVDIVGYQESTLHPDLIHNPLVTIFPLPKLPGFFVSTIFPFILTAPVKVLWQAWTIFDALAYRTKPSRWLLVQNPPSIPTLIVALIISILRRTDLVIDWHNLGWTILAKTKGSSHPYVTISRFYEALLGRWAPTVNFTVTNAMRRELQNPPYNMKSPIFTLHDRPASIFQPITKTEERLHFLERLPETRKFAHDILAGNSKLIVSSTSWTEDEDFDMLLEALCSYDSSSKVLPSLVVIITGKGPQKQFYLDRISCLNTKKKLKNVYICTTWLRTECYATLLACSDLGVCLHKSSSGLDLPMKVVDMFGAGLPVVGYKAYDSWKELVVEGVNGKGFVTSDELCAIIRELFSEKSGKQLLHLRYGAFCEGKKRWDDEWDQIAGVILGIKD